MDHHFRRSGKRRVHRINPMMANVPDLSFSQMQDNSDATSQKGAA
jgi:hypothetical protein